MLYEAKCRKCGEHFNPHSEDEADLEHYVRLATDRPCGGRGEMVAVYAQSPTEIAELDRRAEEARTDPTAVVDFDEVVEALKAKGIAAYVEQTGGNVATIYVGVDPDDNDRGAAPVSIGPGWFEGPAWTKPRGTFEELYVGTQNDEVYKMARSLAEAVELAAWYLQITRWADAVMVMVDEDIADPNRINSTGQRMPETVGSFTELHDYVDANDYLIEAGVPIDIEQQEQWAAVCDEVGYRLEMRKAELEHQQRQQQA